MLPCCVIICTAILIPIFLSQMGQICRHEKSLHEQGLFRKQEYNKGKKNKATVLEGYSYALAG